jgi:general secretion pathway protein I
MSEGQDGYQCRWKIVTIELPEPPIGELETDGGIDPEGAGPLGALLSLQQNNAAGLGETPDIGALAGELGSAVGGGDGLASLVMGFVYPSLKPLLEASIRKVTVTVSWREGIRERTLDVTQYVTHPQLPSPDQLDGGVAGGGLGTGIGALGGLLTGGVADPTGAGTPGPRGAR